MATRGSLHSVHAELGAKFTEFSGFEMPVSYTGILDEHRVVREHVGLFDVSHMSNLWVRGPRAAELVSRLVTSDPAKFEAGQASYTTILRPDGTILDDTIYYKLDDKFHVVPNAGMNSAVVEHVARHAAGVAEVEDVSRRTCIFALQGPGAEATLRGLTPVDVAALAPMHAAETTVAGKRCVLTTSGYTGERGFEFMVPDEDGEHVFRALLEAGQRHGLQPCGLGARDTLRMEMGYCLAGHEFAGGRTPLEAGLAWTVHWDHDFVGKEALGRQKERGLERRLVGLTLEGKAIPRQGCAIEDAGGRAVGEVTSGTLSPTLGVGIALGYVPPASAEAGTRLVVRIRGTAHGCVVTKLPFLKRG